MGSTWQLVGQSKTKQGRRTVAAVRRAGVLVVLSLSSAVACATAVPEATPAPVAIPTETVAPAAPAAATACVKPNAPTLTGNIDEPAGGAKIAASAEAVDVRGWALDARASQGIGVDAVTLYLDGGPATGNPLGAATLGDVRSDIVSAFCTTRFQASGWHFRWDPRGLPSGTHTLVAVVHSAGNQRSATIERVVTVSPSPSDPAGGIDLPEEGDIVGDEPVTLSGWAFDASARTSSGVDAVYLFIRPGTAAGSPATLNTATTIGTATYGDARPDVARRLADERAARSGWHYDWDPHGLPPGNYTLYALVNSGATGHTALLSRVIVRGSASAVPPLPRCLPPPTGLVHLWRGDGDVRDSAGGRDDVAHGHLRFGVGETGRGLLFNGVDDYVDVADASALQRLTSAFTIEAWINPQRSSHPESPSWIFAYRDPLVREAFGLLVNDGGEVGAVLQTSAAYSVLWAPAGSVSSGRLQHVAVTANTSTADVRIYVNGRVMPLRVETGPSKVSGRIVSAQHAFIGRRQSVDDEGVSLAGHYKGIVDELAVYGRALSSAEISAAVEASVAGTCGTRGGKALDTQYAAIFGGSGVVAVASDQRLTIGFAADAVQDPGEATFAGGGQSACTFRGDFDLQVRYELIDWPRRNGVRTALVIGGHLLERTSVGGNLDDVYTDGGVLVPTNDRAGWLRLARDGNALTGYYVDEGSWRSIFTSTVTQAEVNYGLQAWSHDSLFGHQATVVTFTGLWLNSGELTCP